MTPRQNKKEREARQRDQRIAEDSLIWSRRNAAIGAVAILVAIAIAYIAHESTGSRNSRGHPDGVLVNTVPRNVGGAAIYAVPGGEPSAYLGSGVTLRVDCVQPVEPHFLFARVSAGSYDHHWVDVFDIKTPGGAGLTYFSSHLPQCGPEKPDPK